MMKKILFTVFALAALGAKSSVPSFTPETGYPAFALGGDLSWSEYIQNRNQPSYYRNATAENSQLTTIPLMADQFGFDAVRLRVWVNPEGALVSGGFKAKINGATVECTPTLSTCDPEYMIRLASAYARMGKRIMISFQMSDTWADPMRQFIPAAWSSCTTAEQLKEKVVEHVATTLSALRDANVNVSWIQIGNETSTGMLKYKLPATSGAAVSEVEWGCGISSSNPATTRNFVDVFKAASAAAKEIYPDVKTILHIAEGDNWNRVKWTIDNLKPQGFASSVCDYVGLSLYPCNNASASDYNHTAQWKGYADAAIETIGNLYSKYRFRALLCEFGMNNEWSESTPTSQVDALGSQAANIIQCSADVEAMTRYLISNLRDSESTCDGIFYWEPETDYIEEYPKGACVSINPGPSWPRSKVMPNKFWDAYEEMSESIGTRLVPYTISSSTDNVAAPLYLAGNFNSWDYESALLMDYDSASGTYSITIEGTGAIAISTRSGSDFPSNRLSIPAAPANGVTSIIINAGKNIQLPSDGKWEIVVNLDRRTINIYSAENISATYNATLTESPDWPVAYAYVLDADGHQLTGAWPGKRVNSDGKVSFNASTVPATISFSNGVWVRRQMEFVNNATYTPEGLSSVRLNTSDTSHSTSTEYYNLQGVRIRHPEGIYIEKRGNIAKIKTTK